MEKNRAVQNIIFDLGGVLLNIDFQKTFDAFQALGIAELQQYFHGSFSNPLFAKLETGKISPETFYQEFREMTQTNIPDQEIENAWNALLLDFRLESMAYLKTLKGTCRIFLLSNTNQIHLEEFRNIHFKQFGNHAFDDHFEKAWYSHELGLRKPDLHCFEEVLQRHQLEATQTLFVDDTFVNIEGARAAGLQTCWLEAGKLIEKEIPAFIN